MPARGSLVGDAYVRIHADSSAMAKELRRDSDLAGKKTGKSFAENVDKAIMAERKRSLAHANQELVKGVVGGKKEWDKQFKQSGIASLDEFAKVVEKRMRKLHNQTGGKGFKQLQTSLDDLQKWAEDAKIEQAILGQSKALKEQDKAFRTYAKNITAGANGVEDAFTKMFGKERTRQVDEMNRLIVRGVIGGQKDWETAFRKSAFKNVDKFVVDMKRKLREIDTATGGDHFRELHLAMVDLDHYARTSGTGFTRLARRINAGRGEAGKFADIIGKSFGRGSRNNFLNFTGSMAYGVAKIASAIVRAPVKGFAIAVDTAAVAGLGFKTVFKGLGGLFTGKGLTGFTEMLPDLATGLKDVGSQLGGALMAGAKAGIPAVVGIGVAITGIAVAVPPVLAAIGGLIAIIGALAGAVGVGIAGIALALAPVLLAVGAGAGVLIGNISALQDATDKQKAAMRPFTKAWEKFQKLFSGKLLTNFITSLNNFAPLLASITPIVEGISRALSVVTSYFASMFTGWRMDPVFDAFAKSLPVILISVGKGFSSLAAGLMQFLRPILPYAERLAAAFESAMSNFNDWASSPGGQNAIADFMEKAWDVGTKLWNIIITVGEAIGKLAMSGSENGGETLLDKILAKAQEFSDWLSSPEGTAAVKGFFEQAVPMAESLWQSVSDIKTALASIDWEQAASIANTSIEWIGKAIGIVLIAIAWWNAAVWNVEAAIDALKATWDVVAAAFVSIYNVTIGPMIDTFLGALAGLYRGLGFLFAAMGKVPGMQWATDLSEDLFAAADETDRLGIKLGQLPPYVPIDVHVGLSGPGVKLLNKAQATKNPDVYYGAAAGGILNGPTLIRSNVIAGEAGREAVVPLDRPLHMVDKSVRDLAAYAQGMKLGNGGVVGGSSVTIADGAIRVITPNSDPRLVAESVMDRLVASVR